MNKKKTLIAEDFISEPTTFEKFKMFFKREQKYFFNKKENYWVLKCKTVGEVDKTGYFKPYEYSRVQYRIFWPYGTKKGYQIVMVKKAVNIVNNYLTKNKYGFTAGEIQTVLTEHFPEISYKTFDEKMGTVTAMLDEKTKEIIYYHCDVETALKCAIEDREMTVAEWD